MASASTEQPPVSTLPVAAVRSSTSHMQYTARELRAAAQALETGAFRGSELHPQSTVLPLGTSRPDRPVSIAATHSVRVHAGHAGAGASTLALALGDAAAAGTGPAKRSTGVERDGRPLTRIIDAAAAPWSGLAHATHRDLSIRDGWRRGSRGLDIVVERVATDIASPAHLPQPLDAHIDHQEAGRDRPADLPGRPTEMLIIDTGWSARELLHAPDSWLWSLELDIEVVATRATAAGLSQTERLLRHLALDRTLLAVVGGRRPPPDRHLGVGPCVRHLAAIDAVLTVPDVRRGLLDISPASTPAPVLFAARRIVDRIRERRRSVPADHIATVSRASAPPLDDNTTDPPIPPRAGGPITGQECS